MSVACRAFQWHHQRTACRSGFPLSPHGFWGRDSGHRTRSKSPPPLSQRVGPSLTSRFFFSFQGRRMPEVINCCFFYASPLSLPVAVWIPESLPCFWCPSLRSSEDACREQLKAFLCSMQFYLGVAYLFFLKVCFSSENCFYGLNVPSRELTYPVTML